MAHRRARNVSHSYASSADGDSATNPPATTQLALIPSAPGTTNLAPPELLPTSIPFPSGLIPSAPRPPNQIPTRQPGTFLIPSEDRPPSQFPSSTRPPFLIPSGPPLNTNLPPPLSTQPIPSITNPTPVNPPIGTNPPNASFPLLPSMTSTGEGLKPIPAPSTNPGDPDGHHEIPEPNFTATAPCRGCSPAVAIPATGWGDSLPPSESVPGAEPQETPNQAPQATITIGPSTIVIKPEPTKKDGTPSGGGFLIGDSTTVQPGQTITIDKTPLVIQITASRTEVILGGTQTIALPAGPPADITRAPLVLLPVTIGSQTFTPIMNPDTKLSPQTPALYIVSGHTLIPGGAPLTISGTTFSLPVAPTAVVINGKTSTIAPEYGAIQTKTTVPYLTLWHTTFMANAAGNYVLSPGVTLRPGGEQITVSGTVLSLKPGNTEVVVQGSTSFMLPVSTVVTLTRSAGGSYVGGGGQQVGTAAATLPYPAGARRSVGGGVEGVAEAAVVLGVLIVGWLAVWL
ncbi:hypothetical protein CC80DRAFT_542207 [Byssothecium circinans]|uniref:Uncharacterized protein n=1 Tax=Byssothecium circinans TaxID=147558 RepID=A0A6A5UPR3_9PLEO|nr:hypothetical protein CC80DRAFT_542207 [Byssothecium circinans]